MSSLSTSSRWVKSLKYIRHLIQLGLFAVLFQGFLAGIFYCFYSIPYILCHSCPSPCIAKPARDVFIYSIFPLTAVTGRGFCGWICPYGLIQDITSKLGPKTKKIQLKWIKMSSFAVFTAAVIMILFQQGWTNHFDGSLPLDEVLALRQTADPAKLMEMTFYFGTPLLNFRVAFLIAVIMGLSLFSLRFFCSNLCPLGTVLGVGNKVGILRISHDDRNCRGCGICREGCPQKDPDPESLNCIRCFNCVGACETFRVKIEV